MSTKACFAVLLNLTAFEMGFVGLELLAPFQTITMPTFAAAVLDAFCVYGTALLLPWRKAPMFAEAN